MSATQTPISSGLKLSLTPFYFSFSLVSEYVCETTSGAHQNPLKTYYFHIFVAVGKMLW